MKPLVLQLSSPPVIAALRDFKTMQRWEVLRRNRNPMSARELAAACSSTYEEAVASLDLLIEGGFVVRRRATAKCRHATFRVAADVVLVAFDPTKVEQREWINAQRREIRRYSREAVDSYFNGARQPGSKKYYTEIYRAPRLSQSDVARASKILQQAMDAILEIEREAEARAQRKQVAGDAGEPEEFSQYIVAAQAVAAGIGVLPLPNITLMEESLVAPRFSTLSASPKILLTERELVVAERLVSGESRPEVAKSLGVSTNTIASTTKRIYAKLGVKNRAEFVSRMSALV